MGSACGIFLNLGLTSAEYFGSFDLRISIFDWRLLRYTYYEQYHKHCDYHNYRAEDEAALR